MSRCVHPMLMAAALLALAQWAHAQTPAPQPAQLGPAGQEAGLYRIAGTVLDARSGAPLNRAVVTVILAGANAASAQAAAITTGEDGSFSFTGLKAGKYRLAASRRGYVPAAYEEHQGFFTAIVTGPGFDTTNLRFQLTPAAILSGSVTDDAGDPVPGASVSLYRQDHTEGIGQVVRVRSNTTDSSGAFEFTRLQPGDYFVAASGKPWYAFHPQPAPRPEGTQPQPQPRSPLDVAFPTTFYSDTTDPDAATPIPLRPGDHPQLNLTLHAVPALTLRLRVPEPVPDSTGVVHGSTAPFLTQTAFGQTEQVSETSMTSVGDSGQRYMEIYGLAPGEYNLRLQSENREAATTRVELSGDQIVDASSLSAGVDVSGKLVMAFGAPLPDGLNVLLRSGNRGWGGTTQRPAADGTFAFHGVSPGTYELVVIGAGRPLAVVSIEAQGPKSPGNQIHIGNDAISLTAVLADGSATVSGFAKRNGQGAGGAMVVLVPHDPGDNRALFRRDQSNSDGSFSLPRVVPGRYTLIAIEDGWELDWAREEVLQRYLARGIRIEVEPHATEIQLDQAIEIQPR